jgi:hypothetical protein
MSLYLDVQMPRLDDITKTGVETPPFLDGGNVLTNALPATCIHPLAIAMALGTTTYTVLTFWIVFASGEASMVLTMVSLVLTMMLGLMTGCGYFGRNMEPNRATSRSFREFIEGDVDLQSGRTTGRASLCQLATVTGGVALGITSMLVVFVTIAPPAYTHQAKPGVTAVKSRQLHLGLENSRQWRLATNNTVADRFGYNGDRA